MAEGVLMPKEGITVESCIIGEWKKNVGDHVNVGDILFTYETDKAEFECESTASGTLLEKFYEDGDEVPCQVNVCAIGNPGEDTSALKNAPAASAAPAAPAAEAPKAAAPAAAAAPAGPCAQAVIMPKEGITVESCIIGEWKKNVGDPVSAGDVLFTYETDKAEFECESTASGTLLAKFFEDGDEVPCLANVCAVGNPGDAYEFLKPGGSGSRRRSRRRRSRARSCRSACRRSRAEGHFSARYGQGCREQCQPGPCHRHRPQRPHHRARYRQADRLRRSRRVCSTCRSSARCRRL